MNQDHDLMNLCLWVEMENQDRNEQAKREGWSFWTTMMDGDNWNRSYGYTAPEEVIAHQIIAMYYDWHKDRYNYRPTWLQGNILPQTEIAQQCEREMRKWVKQDEEDEQLIKKREQERRERIAANRAIATKNTQLAEQLK